MKTRVVIADNRELLAPIVANAIGASCITYSQGHFADSESWFSFSEDLKPYFSSIVVYRFTKSYSFNEQFFNIVLLLQTLKTRGMSNIILMLPYFPYSRQDAADHKGGGAPLFNVICTLLQSLGVTYCITYDIHSSRAVTLSPFPIHSVDMTNQWATIAKTFMHDPTGYVVAAADSGGKHRAQQLAQALGINFVFIKKLREQPDYVASCEIIGNVAGKQVILVDDILNTGRTAINACQVLAKQGAEQIVGFFTHGIFSQEAATRLESKNLSSVYISDTVLFDSSLLPKNVTIVPIEQSINLSLNLLTVNKGQGELLFHGL